MARKRSDPFDDRLISHPPPSSPSLYSSKYGAESAPGTPFPTSPLPPPKETLIINFLQIFKRKFTSSTTSYPPPPTLFSHPPSCFHLPCPTQPLHIAPPPSLAPVTLSLSVASPEDLGNHFPISSTCFSLAKSQRHFITYSQMFDYISIYCLNRMLRIRVIEAFCSILANYDSLL